MKKLAIITTHPIQYYAPVFELLAKRIELKVFYTGGSDFNRVDQGFKKEIAWDIPLLIGYDFEFLKNVSPQPGSHHFKGIINPDAIQQIKDFCPHAVLVYGWANQSHLKIIRYYKGSTPVYFRGDSTLLDQQRNIKGLLKKIFLKWVYSHIDTAFYVGSASKAYFKAYGLKENQLIFAPHAIDNQRFKTAINNTFREALGIPEEHILILFAGKLEPKKDPTLLLNAFASLGLKNVSLLLVGNGVLEEDLKQRVALEKLKSVYFMDFQNQSQMPVVYQACDLFCLPSQGPGETWGLAVNEAMAAGNAVLVSDKVGCAVDLIKQGVNGAIFKSGDLADLKQKLKTLIESKAILAQMGMASKQIIQDWSFERQVTVIVDSIQNEHAK
ncbi:hypothetical protein OC25_07205 [Pedobacter kyungheensis]|uniref:Glycosyl transferase family 1 domain-containing protein n=1 Tax=Pedobacter kyungheensis TaxID=1069985 RepID=A0A0C1G4U3_9SPHI|nr:glycosyltransferase family 4 protein [Pedobacter kyungheensis]KIA95119.1 hypothetical protein OC25_07205 [Pedobacter kyungheensis]